VGVAAWGALLPRPHPARAADEAPGGPDYEFFKQFVAPVLAENCAECHANPRKRLGKYFLKPMQGRTVREAHHRDNYETILKLIEPGNPSGSLWLLKPLGPGQGGVTHKGGQRIGLDSREYGAMVDFIQGKRVVERAFQPPPSEPGQPDFAFFVARIAPTLASVCAECHAGKGQGKLALRTAAEGTELALEDHYANYQVALGLVDVKAPERSRFLRKPLSVADGGLPHRGGDLLRSGDPNHQNWLAFARGERGPELPRRTAPAGPPVLEAALSLEAETLDLDAGLEVKSDPVAPERKWVVAGAEAARLRVRVRVPEAGDYEVQLDVLGGRGPIALALDGAAPALVDAPEAGRARVGPRFLLDGARALKSARGDLHVEQGRLWLDGRSGEASFLAAGELDHRAVEVEVALPSEEDGGEDAFLLFDMRDADNGKLLGLVDGGRRLVMGLLEGGVPRLLSSARTFAADSEGAARRLRVEFVEGVAVGRLDGQPLAYLHLDRHLGQGRFGVASHGVVEVRRLEAIDQFPVHKVAFAEGPILHLSAGVHVLELELPARGVGLDALHLTLRSD
jgi:hypothetical protein